MQHSGTEHIYIAKFLFQTGKSLKGAEKKSKRFVVYVYTGVGASLMKSLK